VLEASSHGIDFHRLVGCNFNVAAFTNLSQDHLDYHLTMENYLRTKLKLFNWLQTEDSAIVNVDDAVSDHFINATKAKVITYGIGNDADVMAKDIEYQINRTAFTLSVPGGEVRINAKLVGRFNVYNMLAAVGIAVSQNISLEKIKSGLEKLIRVSGRFELVDAGQPFSVVVDYAHTPDGLENVLSLAKSLQPQNLITVFGCGGDRDHDKRPLMGKVVSDYSDYSTGYG
jgi:UDP-N-acetylmuramoyl-L-alanyl-D-glutamate--2,6-diaminopimelate ligase